MICIYIVIIHMLTVMTLHVVIVYTDYVYLSEEVAIIIKCEG